MSDSQTQPAGDDAQQRIAALEAELAKVLDMAARAQADVQNAKARAERDADDLRKFASEAVIRKILPTLDNFQRAFAHVPAELRDHEWVKGVAAIEADLMRHMSDVGLKRMESLGQIVDPQRHEVLSIGPGEAEKVIEVFEEGYELNGKVVRPAKVQAGDGSAT